MWCSSSARVWFVLTGSSAAKVGDDETDEPPLGVESDDGDGQSVPLSVGSAAQGEQVGTAADEADDAAPSATSASNAACWSIVFRTCSGSWIVSGT